MITLIGTTESVIGFGLCGVDDLHEVPATADQAILLPLLQEAKNNVIMIDEVLFERVEAHTKKIKKIIIKIPNRKGAGEDEDIDALVTDTIGVSI